MGAVYNAKYTDHARRNIDSSALFQLKDVYGSLTNPHNIYL